MKIKDFINEEPQEIMKQQQVVAAKRILKQIQDLKILDPVEKLEKIVGLVKHRLV